ncbi:MAG: aspartate aminotransferase family protein [Saprospiraceae bacterium]|nr:aspartate aminotransferase family protein [Saprospiraceae bacterium]
MEQQLLRDKTQTPVILEETLKESLAFLANLSDRPAGLRTAPPIEDHLAEEGVGSLAALSSFQEQFSAGLSGSPGPRYLGFVTGGSTPAGIAGDWLTSVIDQNVASAGDSSASQVEYQAVNWLKALFGIDDTYSGTFVSGATMSSFTGLAIGRQWVGQELGVDIGHEGLAAIGLIPVLSGCAHSSVFKALSMLGMGRSSVQRLPLQEGREAVDLAALRKALAAQKGRPCIVVANSGTVNSVDFDDLQAIGQLKKEFPFWLHVDAAFGGFAACSPQYAHFMEGINAADSITIDLHKMLNVPYDSAIQLTRHSELQQAVFQNSGARYLEVDAAEVPFVHLTPENSRRFRALPTWFSLKAYGRAGFRDLVERNVTLAKQLGDWIDRSTHFTLLSPVHFNVVCFTLDAPQHELAARINQFLSALTHDGRVFLTPSEWKGTPCIRAAFSNWQTQESDLFIIQQALQEVMLSYQQ